MRARTVTTSYQKQVRLLAARTIGAFSTTRATASMGVGHPLPLLDSRARVVEPSVFCADLRLGRRVGASVSVVSSNLILTRTGAIWRN